jgi:hypothetical protein
LFSNIDKKDVPINEPMHGPKVAEIKISETTGAKENKKYVFVEKEVRAYFEDVPELIEVAYCESRFRHQDSEGNLYRGVVNAKDVGVMQVNEYFHKEDSEKLGFDVHELKGNMAYAKYLYEKQGLKPWKASKPCWGEKVTQIRKDKETGIELALNN